MGDDNNDGRSGHWIKCSELFPIISDLGKLHAHLLNQIKYG